MYRLPAWLSFFTAMVPDTSLHVAHPLLMFVILIVFVFVLLHELLVTVSVPVFTIGSILGISAEDMITLVESCFVFVRY